MTGREWLMILGMMGVTFGIRYFLFALANRITMPPLVEASLNYITPAVLISLTFPAILAPKGEWALTFENPYLVSAIFAAVSGMLTRNLLATIAVGLLAFFAYQMLV